MARLKILLPIILLFFISCTKVGLYEKTVSIPVQEWTYRNIPSFTFSIKDTSSLYNIYIVIRHTDAYNYNNLWVRVGSKAPGDSMHYQNINLELANDSRGWEGSGMDDIFEVRKSITPGPVPFSKTGDYTFTITQIMREDPLKHIMNVGIRVERVY